MQNNNDDLILENYNYEIPQELIAQVPVNNRSDSKLIILNRKDQTIKHQKFFNIVNILNENDCLVINTTKVVPARLYGKKSTGGKVEVLFLNPMQEGPVYSVLLKPNIRKDHKIYFEDGYECTFTGMDETGNKKIEFNKKDVKPLLEKYGFMPLPPYIKRKDGLAEKFFDLDKTRYQTIYAKTSGAIAAPTAGLHFTNEILETLKQKKVTVANVILHVGWGTFKPILSNDIQQHKMLPEKYILDEENASKINNALKNKKRIIAVGTTTVRSLETIANLTGKYNAGKELISIDSCNGETEIFIYPGYEFKIVKAMFTNLHLPCSTPLMMASAFAGRDFILSAYKQAIEHKYRFFSYGDSMFIE
ncbi:MAG: tRNA preQ1(34) S-adenosylmethionine ribosyltransferase-isomerase QueA [Endomicrobiaceae bacterium]|nr:tRNA preQ1(34) S-adenosylmethionine ribosyltransferase-isomerase QueA [Endomicrobiaceae bacterium]